MGETSAEKLVVMGDFLDPFGRNPPPAQNVGEERTDVVDGHAARRTQSAGPRRRVADDICLRIIVGA